MVGVDNTGKDVLLGVVEPIRPLIVTFVCVVQVISSGAELGVNVTVKVLALHGYEELWLAVAVNTIERRLRGSASPATNARLLLLRSKALFATAKLAAPALYV